MHNYDVALKLLLRASARVAIRAIAGAPIQSWLNIELPKSQYLRMDLLGETIEGELIHLELQSSNDPRMAARMAEYFLGVHRLFDRFPRQVCVYLGEAPMNMPDKLRAHRFSFEYELIDVRTLDGDQLLASPHVGDNLFAILARLRDHKDAVRKMVAKFAGLPSGARDVAMHQLSTLAALRDLEWFVEQERRRMPVEIDIRKNKVLGPIVMEAELKGELKIIRRQLARRFGPLPEWAEDRLATCSVDELEALSDRIFDSATLEELLH